MYKAKNGTHRGYKNTEKGYNEFIGYVTFSEDAFMEIEVKVNDFGTIDDQITLSNVNEGEYTINFPRGINLNEKTVLEIQPVFSDSITGQGAFIFVKSLLEGDSKTIHFHSYITKDGFNLSNVFIGVTTCIRIINYE